MNTELSELLAIERNFYQEVYDKVNSEVDDTERSEELALDVVGLLRQLIFGPVLPRGSQRQQVYENLTGYWSFRKPIKLKGVCNEI